MAVDIIVHPDPKRDARALKMANDVGSWPKMILKQDFGSIPAGTVVRRAPSSKNDGTRYRVCSVSCDCPDYQQRGAVCYHVRAYRLWEARQQQERAAIVPLKSYRDIFPGCAAGCGDLVERPGERCYQCLSAETRRLETAEKRAAVEARA